MTRAAPMVVTRSPDVGTVRLEQGAWSMSVPLADLPRWIALYRRLRDRHAAPGQVGRYAEFYAEAVAVMERALAEFQEGGHG